MSIVRTWGLATFDGWTAIAFTMHPGDVLEYTIRAEESTIVLFTPPEPDAVFPKPADLSDERMAMKRDEVLQYILSSSERLQPSDLRSARLMYAACICAINANYGAHEDIAKNEALLHLAREALKHLSTIFDLPVDEELSYCEINRSSTDPVLGNTPKLAAVLEGPVGWVYEKCHTCFRRGKGDVGLSWLDQNTTICANGHTWSASFSSFPGIISLY